MNKREITGNIQSLKESVLYELNSLFELSGVTESFLPDELIGKAAELSCRINREIAIYINRKGIILDIAIGDSSTVTLPQIDLRKGRERLTGVRCIHTHPNGDPMLSAIDINSLLVMNMDAMVAVGVLNGEIKGITAAIPKRRAERMQFKENTIGNGDEAILNVFSMANIYGPFTGCAQMDFLFELIRDLDKDYSRDHHIGHEHENLREKAVLVGLELTSEHKRPDMYNESEKSLDELGELAHTAGLAVMEKVLQRRQTTDAAFYIGRGKIEQLSLMLQALGADTLVFDDELTGAQIRNIEELTGVKVLDRTMLILDIFAQRARSSEGKLQVELAQLKYRLPRLIGLGGQLSRLGGGIGTRGPGEKKLESDRRHIRRRITALEAELANVSKRREISRENRKRNSVPVVALVGYTNSGKSTLLNRLCDCDVLAEDKLFATLDPTVRKLALPENREALLVDTVGFIRKLPHELIEAFKSTLVEAVSADLLLHVVDISDDEAQTHIAVVENLLRSLGADDKPVIMVLNKTDKLDGTDIRPIFGNNRAVEISALTGYGIQELINAIAEKLQPLEENLTVNIPYNDGWVLPYLHRNGNVLYQEYSEDGIKAGVKIKRSYADKIRKYVIS